MKNESAESIKIIQEHNWVINFLKNRRKLVEKASASSDPSELQQAKHIDRDITTPTSLKHDNSNERVLTFSK